MFYITIRNQKKEVIITRWFLFLLCFLLIQPRFTYSSEDHDLVKQAMQKRLYEKTTWHKLLVYEKKSSGYKSAIHSNEFFLSSNGKVNPQAELKETLLAFSKEVAENPNQHAQCKYRGRYIWLKSELDFERFGITPVFCPEYEEWSLNGKTESISIMLATGYLGNPASYYGHTLLKMNSKDKNKLTKLEDVTVNYGAIVPDGEGMIPYIFKGLFGGYDAGFSHIQYYFHAQNYGETELRDLWEYELNLSKEEVSLVLAHTWELLRQKYTYFFTKKNCAYRMGEIIEIIDGINIIPDDLFWTIPQGMIQKVNHSVYKDEPLVNKVTYHPSRQTRLYKRYNLLNSKEKRIVSDIANNFENTFKSQLVKQSDVSKRKILNVLLDYYQYIRDDSLSNNDINHKKYKKVLVALFDMPPKKDIDLFLSKNSPHKGRKPSLFSINLVHNSLFDDGVGFKLRPVYYDELDTSYGLIPNSNLSMGEIRATFFEDEIKLRSLDIVKIKSVNNNPTGLPGDTSKAWKLGFGFQQESLSCLDCVVARFQGDIGYALPINDSFFGGMLIGGAVQENKDRNGKLYAKGTMFLGFSLSSKLRFLFNSEYREYLGNSNLSQDRFVSTFKARYELEKNLDIRFSYEKNITEEVSLSLGVYW